MPIYPCKCECGHYDEVYRTVANYKDLPEHCGKQMRRYMTPTNVMEDMKEYRSPLDGSVVSSRKHHRAHMKKHGVIEMGNEKPKLKKAKGYDSTGLRDDINATINDLNRVSY